MKVLQKRINQMEAQLADDDFAVAKIGLNKLTQQLADHFLAQEYHVTYDFATEELIVDGSEK